MEIKIFWTEEEKIKWAKRILQKQGYIIRERKEVQATIAKARNTRQKTIQEKAEKAIEEMKKKGITINAYQLARHANINYRTAQKILKQKPFAPA